MELLNAVNMLIAVLRKTNFMVGYWTCSDGSNVTDYPANDTVVASLENLEVFSLSVPVLQVVFYPGVWIQQMLDRSVQIA